MDDITWHLTTSIMVPLLTLLRRGCILNRCHMALAPIPNRRQCCRRATSNGDGHDDQKTLKNVFERSLSLLHALDIAHCDTRMYDTHDGHDDPIALEDP